MHNNASEQALGNESEIACSSPTLDDIPSSLRSPSMPPLLPSITDSDDWTSVWSPISDWAYVDNFSPFLGHPLDEQIVDVDDPFQSGLDPCIADPLITFAYENVFWQSTCRRTLSPSPNPSQGSHPQSPSKRSPSVVSVEIKEPTKRPVKRLRRQDTTPYHKCSECGTPFVRKHNLTVHIDTKHLRKRPFFCKEEECGRRSGANTTSNATTSQCTLISALRAASPRGGDFPGPQTGNPESRGSARYSPSGRMPPGAFSVPTRAACSPRRATCDEGGYVAGAREDCVCVAGGGRGS
ncbi:hypothetical protein C8Q78DRAFT_19026 [Trametes maxima]|nr:hypothetical protein C8Q78DRAFT_19026 [Trametes maxima]